MTGLSRQMHERIWQFKLTDDAKDCTAFFEERAKALASALNYRLVATSQVEIKPIANIRMVSGRALVEGSAIARKGGRVAKPIKS